MKKFLLDTAYDIDGRMTRKSKNLEFILGRYGIPVLFGDALMVLMAIVVWSITFWTLSTMGFNIIPSMKYLGWITVIFCIAVVVFIILSEGLSRLHKKLDPDRAKSPWKQYQLGNAAWGLLATTTLLFVAFIVFHSAEYANAIFPVALFFLYMTYAIFVGRPEGPGGPKHRQKREMQLSLFERLQSLLTPA